MRAGLSASWAMPAEAGQQRQSMNFARKTLRKNQENLGINLRETKKTWEDSG